MNDPLHDPAVSRLSGHNGIAHMMGLVLDKFAESSLLWSSVFVTLVAKKYRFMQFELDMVFDTR